MQQAFRSLVGRDRAVTPGEFWGLTPCEVWLLIEARQPRQVTAEDEAARSRAADYKAEAEEAGFASVAEFWRWRARHG